MNLTEKSKRRIHLGVGIAISFMLLLVGVLFMWSCYSIYKSGESPFTRESIAIAFSRIAIWVYITMSAIFDGILICLLLPVEREKLRGMHSPEAIVNKLAKKVNLTQITDELRAKIEKERLQRRILGYVRIALIIFSATVPFIFLLNPANFPAVSGRFNAEISHGMLLYLAFLIPFFVYEVVYVILRDLSYNREHEYLKRAVLEYGTSESIPEISECPIAKVLRFIKENQKPITLGVRIAFVGCAVVFVILGILNGGMADVLNKAINICTECIGLG